MWKGLALGSVTARSGGGCVCQEVLRIVWLIVAAPAGVC